VQNRSSQIEDRPQGRGRTGLEPGPQMRPDCFIGERNSIERACQRGLAQGLEAGAQLGYDSSTSMKGEQTRECRTVE